MELKRTIALSFDYDEWQKMADVAHLLENLGAEMQKLGDDEDVILRCEDGGVGRDFNIKDIFRIANEIDFISDGGTITTF